MNQNSDNNEEHNSERDDEFFEDRELPSVDSARRGYGLVNKLLTIFGAVAVVGALVLVNKDLLFPVQAKVTQQTNNIVSGLPPIKELPRPKVEHKHEHQPPVKKEIIVKPAIVNTYINPPIPPKPVPRVSSNRQKKEVTPFDRKRGSDLFSFGGMKTAYRGQSKQDDSHAFEAGDDGSARLADTRLSGARASRITDPSFFLTKGTFFDCALETAIDSTLRGMTKCRITRDIYSADGNVILVDRGSFVVGEYRNALKQGQNRLFVVWDRIETPNNVIIDIASPGTDQLGRSGHDGFVDTHFWQRFGSAIMFSLISDLGDIAVAAASDGDTVSLGGTTQAAKETLPILLEDSLKIAPTIRMHQGDHINIFLAQDLDFRGVYELTTLD